MSDKPCWTVIREFTHRMANGHEYPLLVGDHLERTESGDFVKVAPGLAIGGLHPPADCIEPAPHRKYVIA